MAWEDLRVDHAGGGSSMGSPAPSYKPVHAVPPALSRTADSGLLGKKTGRGFYNYE
jgi:3-hydroxyacyl-CoA dehydrogenase